MRPRTVAAVLLLHLRHELLDEEVFIPNLTVFRVEVERAPRAGREDDEVADLAAAAQFIDKVPAARVQQRLLIVPKTVEVIQDGIVPALVLIETCGQICAIANRSAKHLRVDDRTLGAALGVSRARDKDREQCNKYRTSKLLHSYLRVCTGSSRA